jgi:hypothetical protein
MYMQTIGSQKCAGRENVEVSAISHHQQFEAAHPVEHPALVWPSGKAHELWGQMCWLHRVPAQRSRQAQSCV